MRGLSNGSVMSGRVCEQQPCMQGILKMMMPAPIKYLGPLATWLASYFVSKMSAKYDDECSSASLEKARSNKPHGFLGTHCLACLLAGVPAVKHSDWLDVRLQKARGRKHVEYMPASAHAQQVHSIDAFVSCIFRQRQPFKKCAMR